MKTDMGNPADFLGWLNWASNLLNIASRFSRNRAIDFAAAELNMLLEQHWLPSAVDYFQKFYERFKEFNRRENVSKESS